MTQLMLFDAHSFSSPVTEVAVTTIREDSAEYSPRAKAALTQPRPSIPVHDPKQGEIHRLGDLAQLIIARYELVAQRRRAMEARRRAYSAG